MNSEIVILDDAKSKIITLRDAQVILDRDLALMYGVPTSRLNEAVKRNMKRFPADFMFQLTKEEAECSRSQFATLNAKRGGNIKYLPYAFTRDGVAMLSSVLNSDRAISVNIHIMRAFGKSYDILPNYKKLVNEVEELKKKVSMHNDRLATNFKSIMYLLRNLPPKQKEG